MSIMLNKYKKSNSKKYCEIESSTLADTACLKILALSKIL